LDKLVQEEPERAREISVPALQLIGNILFLETFFSLNRSAFFLGNQTILYTVSIAVNGLYVSVKEGSVTVPNFIINIHNFRDMVLPLFKFKVSTRKALKMIKYSNK
jgi:hypothetical protein